MSFKQRAFVHDSRRPQIPRYTGRSTNLNPFGGNDLAVDRSRDNDRTRLYLSRHLGALSDHQMFPGDNLTFDMAVDLNRPFEVELTVYLGPRIEIRAHISRLSDYNADFAHR